ncbi:MAG TPA: RNA polymerase sigma factor [Candidatus Binataceae bacterium]|nr:RNA polymerase sigma factor [Candidatus Binataceae bacterium]
MSSDRHEETSAKSQVWSEYERLHRAYQARVVGLCRLLLRDSEEAQDVAQEVFLRAFEQLRTQRIPDVWEAWLVRVAVNACRDRQRSAWWKRRNRNVEITDLEAERSLWSTEDQASDREQRVRIWASLAKLRTKQREVFVLRCMEGWSTEETGISLGISAGSVKTHLFRAVRHLRQALEQK